MPITHPKARSAAGLAPNSLTELTEEELLLQTTVRRFAAEVVSPEVRRMDEEQQFVPGLIDKLAELGLLGVEVPEEVPSYDLWLWTTHLLASPLELIGCGQGFP